MTKLPKIPLIGIPDKPLTSTTQEHLPIADITNDIVVYKDGKPDEIFFSGYSGD